MLNWLSRFDTFCFLDSQGYADPLGRYEWVAAAGVRRSLRGERTQAIAALQALSETMDREPAWWFGHFGFELMHPEYGIDPLPLPQPGFPTLFFFEPLVLLRCSGEQVTIQAGDPNEVWQQIQGQSSSLRELSRVQVPPLQGRFSKEAYADTIERLKGHIQQGDCYEINFCQEFYTQAIGLDPLSLFQQLASLSPAPFSSLYRLQDSWLISASPERFLQRSGQDLFAQPIKGTARRQTDDPDQDARMAQQLRQSEKDRAENIMVVDLMRNDLARVCVPGSVQVTELCGLYSFAQVHQLISTIKGTLQPGASLAAVIRACFPMGSMTGAPKKRVLELTRAYERSCRGLYSGSVGYIDPAGDFDFNVVIRSLLYDTSEGHLNFQVGGGITIHSQATTEWEECMLKARALQTVLSGNVPQAGSARNAQ